MKRYTFEIVVEEGNDEFWESLEGKSGCDEVKAMIVSQLFEIGLSEEYENTKITLKKFENTDES